MPVNVNEIEPDEKIVEIEMERLREFRNHPFKVKADGRMLQLIVSISKYEVMNPLIVRPLPEGVYEIISGHRRKYAAQHLGFRKMPVIIRVLRDDDAVISMVDSNLFREYDQVKDHLFIRVSDVKENEAFLAEYPHKEVDGLAISYHIAVESLQGMEASTPVTYQMMEMYGVTEEQLHADALESSQRLYPVKYASMAEVMQQMMGIEPDMTADMMPPIEGPQLMVLTNTQGMHGAGALFYLDQLETIAQQMGTDFFVLPSSAHEVLILPDDGSQNLDSPQFMVREINRTEVAPQDRLSDFVYHYDAQDHVLERAETFAERMAQKEQEAEKAVLQEPEKTAEPREAQMGDSREPEPEKKEHAAGKETREGGEKAERGDERKTSREAELGEAGSRKERRSVLGRLNEKKEQMKGQPKKSGPNHAQEASI